MKEDTLVLIQHGETGRTIGWPRDTPPPRGYYDTGCTYTPPPEPVVFPVAEVYSRTQKQCFPLLDGSVLSIDRQIVGRERVRILQSAVQGALKRYQAMNKTEKRKALDVFINITHQRG